MHELFPAIEQHWRALGLRSGPRIADGDLGAFEARYKIRMPRDVAQYFATLNGLEHGSNGPMDDQMFSFWNLAELKSVDELYPATCKDGASYFVFADFLLSSPDYAVRLTADPAGRAPVVAILSADLIEVAPSFRAFFEHYLRGDPDALIPPVPPAVRGTQRPAP